jgi:type IV secretory pathway VirB4 component
MSVETVVNAVEAEVVKVAEEVKAEVVKAVERFTQEITAEEKLVIREIENEYLKAQMEIQRLSQITQGAQKKFTDTVDSLVKKYAVSPAEWLFDNISLQFKKK